MIAVAICYSETICIIVFFHLFQVFNTVIETSPKSSVLEERLLILYDEITTAIYTNVSRGLFEKHKLVFSFMLNVAIYLNAGIIKPVEWNFLLHGSGQFKAVLFYN